MIARDLKPANSVGIRVPPRHEDNADLAGRANFLRQLDAVAIRKLNVEKQQIRIDARQKPPATLAVPGNRDVEFMFGKIAGDHLARDRIVFQNDQSLAALRLAMRHGKPRTLF